MGKKVASLSHHDDNKSVKSLFQEENNSLIFSFDAFKANSINIKGLFNNHYKDQDDFLQKTFCLLFKALPLLSKETTDIYDDNKKCKAYHLHKIIDKNDLIGKILKEYGYSQEEQNNIFEGNELYQLEIPYINGPTRIVFQRIDNIISFMFMDPNHHIYLDKSKVDSNKSLYYEYCPEYLENMSCDIMEHFKTCIAFEFIDIEKIKQTYDYKYNPNTEIIQK